MNKLNLLLSATFSFLIVAVNKLVYGDALVSMSYQSLTIGSHVYGGYVSGIGFEFLFIFGILYLVMSIIDMYYKRT